MAMIIICISREGCLLLTAHTAHIEIDAHIIYTEISLVSVPDLALDLVLEDPDIDLEQVNHPAHTVSIRLDVSG
jgi:hypothetical protein